MKKQENIVTKAKWVDTAMVRSHHKIALCTSAKDFRFELKRLGVPPPQWDEWVQETDHARLHFFESKEEGNESGKIVIVCVRPNEKDGMFHLIHEAVHVYQEEMKYICERNPSDEFEAYSIEAIATNLIKAYSAKAKKRQ